MTVALLKGTILHNMDRILSHPGVNKTGDDVAKSVFPDHYLYSLLIERKQVRVVVTSGCFSCVLTQLRACRCSYTSFVKMQFYLHTFDVKLLTV